MTNLITAPTITALQLRAIMEQVLSEKSPEDAAAHSVVADTMQVITRAMPRVYERVLEEGYRQGVAALRGEVLTPAETLLDTDIDDVVIASMQKIYAKGYDAGTKAGFNPASKTARATVKFRNPAQLKELVLEALTDSPPPRLFKQYKH